MKTLTTILGSLAVVALMLVAPVQAEMAAVSDSELDAVSGKGNATVSFCSYAWDYDHTTDASLFKGALDNQGAIDISGINTANVWGAYAGSEAFAGLTATGSTSAESTANLAIGGF